jgi:CRISPR/Cas system-associated protein Csx1
MKQWMTWIALAAISATSLAAVRKQRLHAAEVTYESIRGHTESYGSSEKHVVVVLLNGGEKNAEVSGFVTAKNNAKGYTVASCPFKTGVPAGSEVKKKIKCQVADADALELVITPGAKK